MHPSALFLIVVVVCAAGARGHPADITPAARFWKQALPGSPMPEAIADLIQKGIDHSPLAETKQSSADPFLKPNQVCFVGYSSGCRPDAATRIFFHEEQARVGAAMTVSLPARAVPAILPRAAAQRAPFRNLTAVLAAFGIAPGSDRAAGVRYTLHWCDAPTLAGERKACANSLEGTVEAATRMLGGGGGSAAAWAAASGVPREGLPRRAYKVAAVTALGSGDRNVACHSEPFPYAVYQCHMIASTRAYAISLRGAAGDTEDGPAVAMAAICHHDTSNWIPTHPAFAVLHTKPGGAPVCHFMPYGDLLFGEK